MNYEYDSASVLTPSHVRKSLDALTGNNQIQGFAEGSMACAQETFEEILRYIHRDYMKPNYYEKYAHDPDKLKEKEEELEDSGCSLSCCSHQIFGLEIAEFLSCSQCDFVSEVQNTHLDYLVNLYSVELLKLEDSSNNVLDKLVNKMYKHESYQRK